VGQYGPYVTDGEGGTANIPGEMAPDEVTAEWAIEAISKKAAGPARLGEDGNGVPVFVVDGRFGPYVQLGEATGKAKPPRASLLPGMTPRTITLPEALGLLSLPRTLGKDGEGSEVIASNGRFGPYVRRGSDTRNVPADQSVLTMDLEAALALLAAPSTRKAGRSARPAALRELGTDPVSGGTVKVMDGRFGTYVTDGETNATLPKNADLAALSLEDAAALLARKREAGPAKGRFARRGKGRATAAAKSAGAARPAKATKTARADKAEKVAKPTKSTKETRSTRAAAPAPAARPPRATKAAKAEKPEKAEKSTKAEKTTKAGKTPKAATAEKGAQPTAARKPQDADPTAAKKAAARRAKA
jgi:DNA topoisomerase-1